MNEKLIRSVYAKRKKSGYGSDIVNNKHKNVTFGSQLCEKKNNKKDEIEDLYLSEKKFKEIK